MLFSNEKSESFQEFLKLCREFQVSKNLLVLAIQTDDRRKFG